MTFQPAETIRLQFIGCGDAFGSGGQLNTCFYLKSNSVSLLIDCGSSSLPALRKHEVPIRELEAVIITHFHGDHYGGLPFLLLFLATYGQAKPLKILTPRGGQERIEQLTSLLYPGSSILEKLDVEFIEFAQGMKINVSGVTLEAFEVSHTPESLPHGLRLSLEGKIISFSGDTGWNDNLVPLAANADLFICECCFFETEMANHLNYKSLRAKAHLLKSKRIILNHLDQEMLANTDKVEMEYARDGEEFYI